MLRYLFLGTVVLGATPVLFAATTDEGGPSSAARWLADYGKARQVAQDEGKMLLVYFHADSDGACRQFEAVALRDPQIVARLACYICVRLPLDTMSTSGDRPTRLLDHPAFAEMLTQPGVAIIDYAHRTSPYYGLVVSTFPFLNRRAYSPCEMATILDLPPGTLTQRTLIYAVRTHPEHPASTSGNLDPGLANEAENHAGYQARIRLQGHHNWDSRFRRIISRLSFGLASEVCAESWPGQGLLQAAIECVHSWRLSSGHWSAVSAPQQAYGYDMKRGSNGIWYATGIFGRR